MKNMISNRQLLIYLSKLTNEEHTKMIKFRILLEINLITSIS